MYKKVLSLCLVFLLAFSCVSFSVSAYDPLPEKELIEPVLKEAYLEQWIKDYGDSYPDNSEFDGTLEYFYYIGDAGCHVFQAAAIPGSPVVPEDVIGDYRFTACMCMSYCETNPAGVYAYKDGELMTLKEAYEKGLVDLDLLYEISDKNYVMMPLTPEELLENKCKAEFIEEYNIATEDEDEVDIEFAVKFANFTVFMAHTSDTPGLEVYQYLDGYWFCTPHIYGDQHNPTGLYALDNYGNLENLSKMCYEGYIDIDDIYEELSAKCEMHILGDIDGDKRLTVKDATFIQKYLAKVGTAVEKVSENPYLAKRIMDFDLTGGIDMFTDCGDVNVRDATFLQKKLAKIVKDDVEKEFSHEEILVFVSTEDEAEFTLEDFTEYEFESVKKYEYSDDLYILKLKNPGKENAIDAVRALSYREGYDIKYAQLNTFKLY